MQVVENQSRRVCVQPLIVVADGFYEALLHAGLNLAAQRSQRLDLKVYRNHLTSVVFDWENRPSYEGNFLNNIP